MISYLLISHYTFTTNFWSKLKFQFQVIFGHDSFPLKMSPFQVSLLQNSINCFLANGWWMVEYLLLPLLFFYIIQYSSSLQYSFSYACKWLLLNTSSMTSYLIFLNEFFLHLDADSAS